MDRHTEDTDSSKDGHGNIDNVVTLRERIKHFTWAWFTVPLSTAGIALLLAATPHRFDGLTTIGKIFFIFALVTYVVAIAAITVRFRLQPAALRCSLMHPHESLFFPTAILSSDFHPVNNLIGCAQVYGAPYCGPWYPTAMRVLFWIYIAIAFVSSALQYLHLFAAPVTRLTIQGMTPAWILPIFPILLSGTLASVIAPSQSAGSCLTVIIAGATYQGLGWMVAFLMYAIYIRRLMQFGLPAPNLRPGMIIAVGPPSFTIVGLIGLSSSLPLLKNYGYFITNPQAIAVLMTVADFTSIFLWTMSIWFFFISFVAVVAGVRQMDFHLIWWALVFPNIAIALATAKIGERLESEGIMWVASIMTILLVGAWIWVFILNMRAVLRKNIMMPGKDEDKEECPGVKPDDEKPVILVP